MSEFDGDAISQTDRDFLDSLGDHPLARHPLYGVPCPLQPDFGPFDPEDDAQREARETFFGEVVMPWMLANWAYREGAFMGKDGAISLVDGEVITLAALRGRMQPWALLDLGPRKGIKMHSPVEAWMISKTRRSIRQEETRSDRPRPTFVEGRYEIFNRYRPPAHPAAGGDLTVFNTYFGRLFPNSAERDWMWNWLAHKARRPWIPMIAVIMVAEEFGSGRGTLFDILEGVFGKDYVVPCSFGELTGTSAAARFNARMADALVVVVNEAVAEEGHQQTQRRLHYDALKNAIEPSPTARRRFEAKGQHAYAQRAAMSAIIATQHRDVVKLPAGDRRFSVITCGPKMTVTERAEIRAWMADPANLGALYRALLAAPAVPLDVFDPFGVPPPFAGRLEMIGMAKSGVEDAYEAALATLAPHPLFTLSQALKLIGALSGGMGGSDNSDRARYTVAKNAYRLRRKDEAGDRIRYRGRQEILYARTEVDRWKWREADRAMIVAALDRVEARIACVLNGSLDGLAGLAGLAGLHRPPPSAEEDREE